MTESVESIFSVYDELADEVVSSTEPNTDANLRYTNRELVENICFGRGWEDFDLFETHDFEAIHAGDDPSACLDYAFLAFLRWRVFTLASSREIGLMGFNIKAAAHSEYWYMRLVDRWASLRSPEATPKKWMH